MVSRAALHEGAHVVAAALFGREPISATVGGGTVLAGCSKYTSPNPIEWPTGLDPEATPFVLWPTELAARLTAEAVICACGDVAEQLLSEPEGRKPDPVTEVAAEMAASVPASEHEVAWAATTLDSIDHRPDDVVLAQITFAAVGRDPAVVAAWLNWIDVQARMLVLGHAEVIRAVADGLDRETVLGAQQLARLIP